MYFCMFYSILFRILNFYLQKWGVTWDQVLHNSGKDLQNSVQVVGLTQDIGSSFRFTLGSAS
jgi:hypothetical protein